MTLLSASPASTRLHAIALLLAGLLIPIPAVWHAATLVQDSVNSGTPLEYVPLWIYLLVWTGIIQVAYAVYVLHLPDWSSLAVTAIMLVILAAAAAILLGLTMFAEPRNQVLALLELAPDVAVAQRGVSPTTTWCLVLVCVTSLLALWFGQDAAERRRSLARPGA